MDDDSEDFDPLSVEQADDEGQLHFPVFDKEDPQRRMTRPTVARRPTDPAVVLRRRLREVRAKLTGVGPAVVQINQQKTTSRLLLNKNIAAKMAARNISGTTSAGEEDPSASFGVANEEVSGEGTLIQSASRGPDAPDEEMDQVRSGVDRSYERSERTSPTARASPLMMRWHGGGSG